MFSIILHLSIEKLSKIGAILRLIFPNNYIHNLFYENKRPTVNKNSLYAQNHKLIKIDTQGAEYDILKGGKNLLIDYSCYYIFSIFLYLDKISKFDC